MTHISGGFPEVIKTIDNRGGLAYRAVVTTATSTTVFASTDLINLTNGNDNLVGWWIYVEWDAGAASGAPQGEYRMITDYVDSTGTVTHNAFSAQLALTDVVTVIHPVIYGIIAARGGTPTLAGINAEQRAGLDFARVQTIASPTTLTGSAQYIYSRSGSARPFYFAGGFLSWDSGAWAGGEDVDITVDLTVDGTNWENMWTKNLAAAASPLTVAVPSGDDEDNSLNIPQGFWVGSNCGLRVGIVQSVEGAGYGIVSHNFVDGVPRS